MTEPNPIALPFAAAALFGFSAPLTPTRKAAKKPRKPSAVMQRRKANKLARKQRKANR